MVWFPNPGSPLVSGMSRCVAVSGAFVVFTVYKYMTYLPGLGVVWFSNPLSPLISLLSRFVVVSTASVVSTVSADTSFIFISCFENV